LLGFDLGILFGPECVLQLALLGKITFFGRNFIGYSFLSVRTGKGDVRNVFGNHRKWNTVFRLALAFGIGFSKEF
jgi:hypothetical protein